MLRRGCGKLEPQGGEDSQLMAVPEEQDIPIDRTHARDHPTRAVGNFVDRLTAHDTVTEQRPSGPLRADLVACQSIVLAVVPLDEIRIDHRPIPEACDVARLSRALQWADEHGRDVEAPERRDQGPRLLATFWSQREVGAAGVALFTAPRGFAVTHHHDLLRRVARTKLHGARLYLRVGGVAGSASGFSPTTSHRRSATAAVTASGSCSRWSTQKWQWSRGNSRSSVGSKMTAGFASTPGTSSTAARARRIKPARSASAGSRTPTVSRRVS